jgi:hypothetical protein
VATSIESAELDAALRNVTTKVRAASDAYLHLELAVAQAVVDFGVSWSEIAGLVYGGQYGREFARRTFTPMVDAYVAGADAPSLDMPDLGDLYRVAG